MAKGVPQEKETLLKIERLMIKLDKMKRSHKRKLLKIQVDVVLRYKLKHSVRQWVDQMEGIYYGTGNYS